MNVLTRNYFPAMSKRSLRRERTHGTHVEIQMEALYRRAEREEVLSYIKDDAPHISINFEDYTRKFRSIARPNTTPSTLRSTRLTCSTSCSTTSTRPYRAIPLPPRHYRDGTVPERKKGDKVDFCEVGIVVPETWRQQVDNQLHGSVLISLFGFNIDELPFMTSERALAEKLGDQDQTSHFVISGPLSALHNA